MLQFSRSVVSDSLRPHGLQHARPPCPSSTLGAYSNSCPSSWWCHTTVSSSVIPFSSLQSFPASRSFQMSQFFASGDQSIGASASASALPMNIQDWFLLGLTGLISLQSKRLSSIFSTPQLESISSLVLSLFSDQTLTSVHDYWQNNSFDYMQICQQSMSLLFSTLSRFLIAFLWRSKCLLISWLQSPSSVILCYA